MKFKDTMTDEECDSDDLPIQVCHSFAGYYIGQLEPCGAPYDRLSDYFKTKEDAEKALSQGWSDRDAMENKEVIKGLVKKGKIKSSNKTDFTPECYNRPKERN
jgi:hypothetical protein